ncbi:MAG: hypothetical protein AB7T07_03695 [Steroidobacteraceae bacterium]
MLASAAGAADAGTFRANIGLDYASGKYGGTESITQIYLPVSVAYRSDDNWGLRLTVPYVAVSGPATIIDANGELVTGPDRSSGGLGDVTLAATLYDVVRNDAASFYVDLGAKVKLGTASEADGLGTGKNDYSLQADVLKYFDRFALFGTVGYKWRGDPQGTQLRDVAFAMVGGDYLIGGKTRAGLMFDYRPSSLSGGDALQEATFYLSFPSKSNVTIQPYVVAGFSDSSPDWGAGISIGFRHQDM